jgi:class 3 adenylate cyclase/tetratricopeptide (TPR) repeat protein
MKCSKCQTENPETRKFCRQCGAKLSLPCPKCGYENIPGDKFCGECGHDLAVAAEPIAKPLSFDEKLKKIQRYLPGGLTEKILAQRGKIEGERRQVTVMFCDVEGFTSISEKLSEDKVYSVIDELFEMMIHKVHEYGGTVNKGTGDGIMALFGAPIAVEDAPQRAIRSALAIQQEMAKFSGTLSEQADLPPLKMRIGIHTGPVVVGTLGNDLRVEFTAVGDTVNLASRMVGQAEPGTVYVTEDTFKLTEGFFRFERLGERQVKGKEQPVRAYRVIAPSTRRTRFDVSAEMGLTPFVGRHKELELLLDGFERARTGKGQAFSIMGEAGVGKSRLLYEFRKAVGNEDVTFLEGKCLSYIRGLAYHPILDILKSNFDIREGEPDYQIRDRVMQGLKQLDVDQASTLPYLLDLLGVKESGIDKIPLSPEGKKDRMLEAVKRINLKSSEIKPLILAIEDLHWADTASEEALKYLMESIPGARILLILTYRPEFVHTWGSRSYHSQVNLNRLSNRESLAMLAYLLGTEAIETPLQELMLQKTEGIPLFIEEFIKSFTDLKIVEKKDSVYLLTRDIHDVSIPGTIQDVIMARVDSLPDAARGVLQAGSAIEREFDHELIKRVLGLPEPELLSHLSALKDAELLYERGIYPKSTYIFRHALTREVVYGSILAPKKKKLHLDIASAIEEMFKDKLDEHYGALVEHYTTGENYGKAADYCMLAAMKALAANAVNDVITYARKGVSCLEKLPQTEDVSRKIIDARTTLGMYLQSIVRLVEAKEAVKPALDLALKLGYKPGICQAYVVLGFYSCAVAEDYPRAYEYLTDALRMAEELNAVLPLATANTHLGLVSSCDCEWEKALYHWGKALDMATAGNVRWLIIIIKTNMAIWLYHIQGKTNLGFKESSEALQMAEESGDIFSKSWGYLWQGISYYHKGYLSQAEEHLLRGIGFFGRTNDLQNQSLGNLFLAQTYLSMGKHAQARDACEKGIPLSEQVKAFPSSLNVARLAMALAKVLGGDAGIELEPLYAYQAANKDKRWEGTVQRYLGAIILNVDMKRLPEAEGWIRKAIEADTRNGTRFYLAEDFAQYAELCKRKGDPAMAKEKLGRAIEIFTECGADGWVKKAQEELAQIEKPVRKR